MRTVTLSSVNTYVLLLCPKYTLLAIIVGCKKRVSLYLSRKTIGAVQCKVSRSMTLWGGGLAFRQNSLETPLSGI